MYLSLCKGEAVCVGTKIFLVFLCIFAVIAYICNWSLLTKQQSGHKNGILYAWLFGAAMWIHKIKGVINY